jgi:predicted nucleic acid-binding protein
LIVCPNTSPLLVLARIERLDLLGEASSIIFMRAVLAEVRDKMDAVTERVESLVARAASPLAPDVPASVDPGRDLGAGERSVLAFSLSSSPRVLCVLDDRAARSEARRLGLPYTGTLGLILRAKLDGRLALALPVIERAVEGGLFLDDATLDQALKQVGESWRRRG